MARTQFTFTFPNAQPGAAVTFSAAVYSSPADQVADGPTLWLDSTRTVAVWADVSELTATWVDGAGASITAEASVARPVVTATGGGVPGAPAPTGGSVTVQDEGTPLATAADTLNFVGAGVTATGSTGTKTVTIPGAGLPTNYVTKVAGTDSPYTGAANDWVKVNATAATYAVTLPTGSTATTKPIAVEKTDTGTNAVTINAPSGGSIFANGVSASSVTLSDATGVLLAPQGSNVWNVAGTLGSNRGPAGTNGTNGTNGAISLIQEEGSALTVRPTLNFIGAAVTAADDAANSRTNITVTAGSGDFVKIAETVLSSTAASVALSSIPGTYRTLRLEVSSRCNDAATSQVLNLTFNGDTGTNYEYDNVYGPGNSTPGVAAATGANAIRMGRVLGAGATANRKSQAHVVIHNYAGTTFDKTCTGQAMSFEQAATANLLNEMIAGLWLSTTAITSVTVAPAAGSFIAGTVVTLYGQS